MIAPWCSRKYSSPCTRGLVRSSGADSSIHGGGYSVDSLDVSYAEVLPKTTMRLDGGASARTKAWTCSSGVAGKHQMRSVPAGMFGQVEGCSKSNLRRCSEGIPARLFRGLLLVA